MRMSPETRPICSKSFLIVVNRIIGSWTSSEAARDNEGGVDAGEAEGDTNADADLNGDTADAGLDADGTNDAMVEVGVVRRVLVL